MQLHCHQKGPCIQNINNNNNNNNVFSIRALLGFIASKAEVWKGLMTAVCMMCVIITGSILQHRSVYLAFTSGMNIRSTVTAIVYRKVITPAQCPYLHFKTNMFSFYFSLHRLSQLVTVVIAKCRYSLQQLLNEALTKQLI